jgi:phosphatidylglycerophosphatase A
MPRRFSGPFLLATWFGCGYSPVAPGTAGSLVALVIAIALHYLFGYDPLTERLTLLALALILFAPGVWSASGVARETGINDPQIVVIDEVIGQWITLTGASVFNWKSWLVAFALFRLLDVWKPPPVRQLERLPLGWGIVADDAAAGVYGALAIFVLDRLHLFSYGF